MQIIPVIDLMDGKVVHAKFGNRNQYQAINSSLCKSSDIFDVISAFLELYPFKIIYIADLNGLTNKGRHEILLNKVLNQFTQIKFWIDAGDSSNPNVFSSNNYLPVIGSESCLDSNIIFLNSNHESSFILSLDFSSLRPLGPEKLFENPEFWPKNIIIMTLGRVGGNTGPALDKLEYYRKNHPEKNFVAAGGIRNIADLILLKKTGINQALIATALHNGSISATCIKNL